jgi:hypothetical protein
MTDLVDETLTSSGKRHRTPQNDRVSEWDSHDAKYAPQNNSEVGKYGNINPS